MNHSRKFFARARLIDPLRLVVAAHGICGTATASRRWPPTASRLRPRARARVLRRAAAAAPSARRLAAAPRVGARPSRAMSHRPRRRLASGHFSGESCALTTSVIAPTVEEALAEIVEAVEGGADIVELRVDFIDGLDAPVDLPKMLAACAVPCIVTYRPTWEGGQYAGEEEPRLAALWAAVDAGAAYVDCELLAAERFFAAAPRADKDASRVVQDHPLVAQLRAVPTTTRSPRPRARASPRARTS